MTTYVFYRTDKYDPVYYIYRVTGLEGIDDPELLNDQISLKRDGQSTTLYYKSFCLLTRIQGINDICHGQPYIRTPDGHWSFVDNCLYGKLAVDFGHGYVEFSENFNPDTVSVNIEPFIDNGRLRSEEFYSWLTEKCPLSPNWISVGESYHD